MRKFKFLVGAFAAVMAGALASCTNDEPNAPDTGTESWDGDKYMAVRIKSTGSAGARGANDQYELGTDTENKITAENIRFYFFNDQGNPFVLSAGNVNGTVSETNMVKPVDLSSDIQNGNTTGAINGVLVLGKPAQGYVGTQPAYVVCVANRTAANGFEELANIPMSQLAVRTVNKQDQGPGQWDTFIMASSTYIGQDRTGAERRIFYSDVKDKFHSTPQAAEGDPVDIYIERLAVKNRVKGLDTYVSQVKTDAGYTDALYEIVDANGNVTETKLSVELTGWQVWNKYSHCRVFKLIEVGANYFPNWNDPTYHRSYWSVTPGLTSEILRKDLDIYDASQFALGNYSYTTVDGKKVETNIDYCHPNTAWNNSSLDGGPQSVSDRTSNATGIFVRGVVKLGDEAIDMVRWAGSYYRLDDFKTLVINTYNKTMISEGGSQLTVDAVSLVADGNGDNHYKVQVNKTDYSRFNRILWWKDGVTSFYINIKHADDAQGKPLYGLVRNHIYETEISSVVGLGVPGNDIQNPEVEDETFLAARINVLNWRVISNSVVLE